MDEVNETSGACEAIGTVEAIETVETVETVGLQTLAPMFEPLQAAMLAKLRSEQHWHADETRWAVFVPMEGKVGHRWYLWVYHPRFLS